MEFSLVLEGHPSLSKICDPWNNQEDAEHLVREMARVMFSTNGLGLAAPQVGLPYQMFIMGNQEKLFACFNPKVISYSTEEYLDREGCLSFPGLWLNVKRPESIVVEYFDIKGERQERKFSGMMARCFLHELDHLNGICFTTRVGKLSLKMSRERQSKWLKKGIK